MEFFQTEIGQILIRAVVTLISLGVLVSLAKSGIQDFKNQGYKGIINEIILGVLTIAIAIWLLNSGLETVINAIGPIVAQLIKIVTDFIEYVVGG